MADEKSNRRVSAAALKEAIGRAGLSQAELARLLGLSKAAITHWLNGERDIPVERLPQLAKATGVEESFLLRSDEEDDPLPELTWVFRPAPPDGGRDYGNSNVFTTPPDLQTLVRESGQNSKDQVEQHRVSLQYAIIELVRGTPAYVDFFEALRFPSLREHLLAAGNTDSRLGRKLKSAIARFDGADRVWLLRIDDFGATGLFGHEHSDGTQNPFAALIRNNLDSSKSDKTAGGAFGLGKAVLWRCSNLSTVLFASKIAMGRERADQQRLRFIAKSELTWHDTGFKFAGPGWLGGNSGDSVWVSPDALRPFFLDRTRPPDSAQVGTDSGTSALILDFRDPREDEDSVDPDRMIKLLADAAAENFWPAIEDGELTITITHQQGHHIAKTITVTPEHTAVRPFVLAYRSWKNGEISAQPEPGETCVATVKLSIPETKPSATAVAPRQPTQQTSGTLVVRMVDDEEPSDPNLGGRVAIFRGRKMVVRYWDRRNIVVGGKPFHAILMAGEAAGIGPLQTAAEIFLRLAEPPAHNQWVLNEELSDNYHRGSKIRLAEFFDDATTELRKLIRVEDTGIDDEPSELAMRLVWGGTQKQAKPALLRNVRGQLKDGAWHVSGEIRVLAKKNRLNIALPLTIAPESGKRLAVGWANVVVESVTRGSAAVQADGTLVIEPRTSTVKWSAQSKQGPSGIDLERCFVQVEARISTVSE